MLETALAHRSPRTMAVADRPGGLYGGSSSRADRPMLYSPEYPAFSLHAYGGWYTSVLPMEDKPINLNRLAQMDPEAVADVHDRYFADVFRYARYRVSNADVAEDIASDVFVRLLEAVKRGKAPHSNLHGWLLSTCSNAVNDHFRKLYQQDAQQLDDSVAAGDRGPARPLDAQGHLADLGAALAQLTPDQQHIIALRFGAGYSLQETSKLTGKQVNAVKALQFRAIRALRRIMDVER